MDAEKTLTIPDEDMFLYGAPNEGWTPDRMRSWLTEWESSHWYGQCLADMLAQAWNHRGALMHKLEEGECTEGDIQAWSDVVDDLTARALSMTPEDSGEGAFWSRLKPFMERHSYRDGDGWWSRKDDRRPASVYTPVFEEEEGLREWVLSLIEGYEVKTHNYGDKGYEDIDVWETYYEVAVPALKEPLWIDYGEGERLTLFYAGWHEHYEYYVNDLQWFEWRVSRFLAGEVEGLCDLEGNPVEG